MSVSVGGVPSKTLSQGRAVFQLFELCLYHRLCFSGRGAVIDTEPGEDGISTI